MIEVSCIYIIKSKYKEMSGKEKIVANYILANPKNSVYPSIEELSILIGVSQSTLVRFVHKLGYSGYQRFRIALATETIDTASRFYERPINQSDDRVEVVFNSAISTLKGSKRILDREAIAQAADQITNSKKLFLFGIGGSNIVAQDAFHKFIRTGLDCVIAEDYHIQLMLASQADSECVALVISHTGANMDTLAIVEVLKQAGCSIVVLTSNPQSALARAGNILLSVKVTSISYISEAFSSRIAHLVVIDALYVEIMERLGSRGVENLNAMRQAIAKRRT